VKPATRLHLVPRLLMRGTVRTSAHPFVFSSFGLINHSKIYTPSAWKFSKWILFYDLSP